MLKSYFNIELLPLSTTTINLLKLNPQSSSFSSSLIEEIILPDQSFCIEVLKLANSSLYAQSRTIAHLKDAITLIGFKTLKNFALMLSTKDALGRIKLETTQKYLCELPIVSAIISQELTMEANLKSIKEDVFIACLLKSFSMTLFALKEPLKYDDIIKKHKNYNELKILEKEIFSIDHEQLSKKLFEYYELPKSLIENLEELNTTKIKDHNVILLREMAYHLGKQFLEIPISRDDDIRKIIQTKLNIDDKKLENIEANLEQKVKPHPFYQMIISENK